MPKKKPNVTDIRNANQSRKAKVKRAGLEPRIAAFNSTSVRPPKPRYVKVGTASRTNMQMSAWDKPSDISYYDRGLGSPSKAKQAGYKFYGYRTSKGKTVVERATGTERWDVNVYRKNTYSYDNSVNQPQAKTADSKWADRGKRRQAAQRNRTYRRGAQ